MRKTLLCIVSAAALLTLPACMVSYLGRQGLAQLQVLAHREPLEQAMQRMTPAEREKVALLIDARQFGKKELSMPIEGVYETWSGVHTDPIWNVSACHKDRLEPYLWKYPMFGAMPYIGFYDRKDADLERKRLQEQGFDVQLYGAGAFSSLGWFSDPVVPSMLRYDTISLVNTVLHESAHRFLFVKGAIEFNESFASFVGDQAAIRFFATRHGWEHEITRRAIGERLDAAVFGEFIQQVVLKLETLYRRKDLSRAQKIAHRDGVFADAKVDYGRLPLQTDEYDSFQRRELDNAVILSYRRYGSGQELFDQLLERCDGDLNAAMALTRQLDAAKVPSGQKKLAPFTQLKQWLESDAHCSAHTVKS